MKYTTKQSRIEEITLDLEDGCILKLTNKNTHTIYINKVVDTVFYDGKHHPVNEYYEVSIGFTNGIEYETRTTDKTLAENLWNFSGKVGDI